MSLLGAQVGKQNRESEIPFFEYSLSLYCHIFVFIIVSACPTKVFPGHAVCQGLWGPSQWRQRLPQESSHVIKILGAKLLQEFFVRPREPIHLGLRSVTNHDTICLTIFFYKTDIERSYVRSVTDGSTTPIAPRSTCFFIIKACFV